MGTSLCQEHGNLGGGQRNTRTSRRGRCHRYYCPFAHGIHEIRSSPLDQEMRERCLQGVDALPSEGCCQVCARHWLILEQTDSNWSQASHCFQQQGAFLWSQDATSLSISSPVPESWGLP